MTSPSSPLTKQLCNCLENECHAAPGWACRKEALTSNKLTGRELEFGELIQPLFEHLPEIPVGEWHRFSFDVAQLKDTVQVVHIRFLALSGDSSAGETKAQRDEFAWLLEIPGTEPRLYFGPNRCPGQSNPIGYLKDITSDHMRAVRFQRQEDAITTADWLQLYYVNADHFRPPRDFVPVEHGWHDRPSEETSCRYCAAGVPIEKERENNNWRFHTTGTGIHPCTAEKASEQECRSAGPSGNAAGTGPVDTRAEARLSRREITAQKASEERCRSGHLYEGRLVRCCKDENHSGWHYNFTVDYHWGSENGKGYEV